MGDLNDDGYDDLGLAKASSVEIFYGSEQLPSLVGIPDISIAGDFLFPVAATRFSVAKFGLLSQQWDRTCGIGRPGACFRSGE